MQTGCSSEPQTLLITKGKFEMFSWVRMELKIVAFHPLNDTFKLFVGKYMKVLIY